VNDTTFTHDNARGTPQARLDALKEQVLQCHRCGLRDQAHHVVFGEGAPAARVVLVGEGPGAEEDRQGRPFVGAAGQLLDRMLQAIGMTRTQHVYILNVVKCRPPGNRVPTEDEQAACRPHLDAQLTILNPSIVVLLGSTALKAFFGPKSRISEMRGQWLHDHDRWVMPTYHPAALLRNPAWKRASWEDLKKVVDKYRELVDPAHDTPYYPLHHQHPVRPPSFHRLPPV
jgi:uracil-DNA glycosylase family 4